MPMAFVSFRPQTPTNKPRFYPLGQPYSAILQLSAEPVKLSLFPPRLTPLCSTSSQITSDAPTAPGSSNCQDHRCCFSCSFVSLPPQIPLLVRCSDPRRAIRPGRRILRGVNVPPAANFWLHSCKLTLCRPNVTFGTCRILQLNRHVAHGGMISLFC
jgi:hypothetical protein